MTIRVLRLGVVAAAALCLLIIGVSIPVRRNQLVGYGQLRQERANLSTKWTAEQILSEDGQELTIPPIPEVLHEADDGVALVRQHLRTARSIRHYASTVLATLLALLLALLVCESDGDSSHGRFMGRCRDSWADLQEELPAKRAELGSRAARRWYWRQVMMSIVPIATSAMLLRLRPGNRIG